MYEVLGTLPAQQTSYQCSLLLLLSFEMSSEALPGLSDRMPNGKDHGLSREQIWC